ncbi:chromodomain-helicase-DNA-binding protein 5-like [Iris pallida]|uniref:Chromodomain-helicase-DNA-binding protein 5-like n=1 Tax=Iris pallida TaxID=29817 RepID=A0AAX6EUJ5_IRIPA|nr:chromodomain-helicase-DNA-binding protein 5-like [Iris pallida]
MAAKAEKTNSRKKRLAVDSESLESDFVTSDDDFVLEEDQVMVNRTKSGDKAKKTAGSRGRRKKSSDLQSGSSDSDYVISDEDELIERDQVLVYKQRKDEMKQPARSKTRRKMSSAHSKSSDADYKILEEDDSVVKDRVSVGRRKKLGRGMAAKAAKTNSRKKRLTVDSESLESDFVTSDDDFVLEEDQGMVNRMKSSDKAKKTARSRGRRKNSSALESGSSDSDYVISDKDELIERDQVLVHKQRKDKMKQQARSKTRRKMSSAHSKSSDADCKILEDDYFTTREEILVDKKKEKMKEAGCKTRRKRFSVESESSDSDYIISEGDDFMVENKIAVVKQHKNKKGGKRQTEPSTRRKRSSLVSDSSDNYDDLNFEEEVRDLRLGGGLNQQHQLAQLVVSKHKEEKGKEKEASELGKQVCGICLSEEQKGVVQGLLNCCSHYFCFACIMEWSKVESRCPVCKRRFVTITKSGRSDPGFGMRKAVIRVEKRDQVYHPSEEELRDMLDPYENVVCIECQQGGDDNLMLLCDICDSSSHTYCVGLGREVPEGNWYCGGCKSASDGQMLSQAQDNMMDQETGGNSVFVGVTERGGFTNMRLATNSPQPVSLPSQTSTLRIDLNASPRDFSGEDHYASSPIYGSGASTLSGRRHIQQRIQQRIRILLSNSRPRQNSTGINMHSSVTDAITSEGALVEDTLHASRRVLEHQQDCRPAFHSNATMVPCMLKEGSSFRHVDGAKEQIQSMVLSYLQKYSRDTPLERTTFKEVGRKSTHTILAACGIEHRRDMVSADVEPPNDCAHDPADGPAHLAKGCCSSCFNSFVKDVVLRLLNFNS